MNKFSCLQNLSPFRIAAKFVLKNLVKEINSTGSSITDDRDRILEMGENISKASLVLGKDLKEALKEISDRIDPEKITKSEKVVLMTGLTISAKLSSYTARKI